MKEQSKSHVEMVNQPEAEAFLKDTKFVEEAKLHRMLHIVRDPNNPKVILSMTVMETSPV